MTNTTCYNVEGIKVCTPDGAEKFVNYALIGIAVLAGIALLAVISASDASITGTELLNNSGYLLGY